MTNCPNGRSTPLADLSVLSGHWSLVIGHSSAAAGDQGGDVTALEAAVDVDDDDTGRAAVEHRQERSESAEGGAVADAGRHGNDRTIDQSADDAGQGAIHAG